jgi:hypothetical protein
VAIPVVGVGGGYVALVLGVATERVSPGAIMPIIGATFFVGIIGLLLWSELPKRIVRDSALRALEDAFKTSARRHGDVVALDFVRDGHPVHLEVSTNRRGLLGKVVPFFVVRTRARARFQLSAEGYVRALKSAVGIDDILTGDAAFDDAAHLRGHPETTRSYFSHPDVRAAASTLLRDDLCRSLSLDDSGDLRVTTKVRVARDATETVLAQQLEATVGRATALARVLESVSGVVVETLPRASVALGGDESSVAVPALTTTASSR